jgi:glutamate transport system substrate-binding protein
MKRIQDKGKLVVGTKFDQPLFGQKTPGGDVEGFDTEIARQIAKAITGSEDDVEFVEAVSKNREPFIEQGKVDIVVATYTINDKRKEVVAFAGPYYIAGQDIMVKADDDSIGGVEDLAGKKVCSVEGSTSEQNVKEQAPEAEVLLFDTYSKCAQALGDGRVQAVSTDNVILLGLVDASKGAYKLVGKPFTEEPYGIGVKKDDTAFRTFINDELEKMYEDGRWAKAFADTVGKVEKTVPAPPAVDRYE